MNKINRTAQLILLFLIFIFIAGFFFVPSKISYAVGSGIMYVMCSVVLNKMQLETKELEANIPIGEKPKNQWGK